MMFYINIIILHCEIEILMYNIIVITKITYKRNYTMKKASIITLTYNQLERATKPYIESLYKNTDEKLFNLIIVDNGSTDGTVEYLKTLMKEKNNLHVIFNAENKGYSKGNNQGIKFALEYSQNAMGGGEIKPLNLSDY